MPRSMTGYGAGEASGPRGRAHAEVRGVNARFLEIRTRLPQPLASLEPELKRRLATSFARGRLDLNVSWEAAEDGPAPVRINAASAKAYLEGATRLKRELGVEGDLDLSRLLALPGVVEPARQDEPDEAIREIVLEAVDGAARAAMDMRRAEGDATAVDLTGRLGRLQTLRASLAQRAAEIPAAVQRRLTERLARLGVGDAVDPSRLAQEVAFLADRADVSEELARLDAHLDRCRDTLAREGEPAGKTLEFIAQELLREVNTIGSKAADTEIAGFVLEMKTEIERVREQTLNLE